MITLELDYADLEDAIFLWVNMCHPSIAAEHSLYTITYGDQKLYTPKKKIVVSLERKEKVTK